MLGSLQPAGGKTQVFEKYLFISGKEKPVPHKGKAYKLHALPDKTFVFYFSKWNNYWAGE